MRLNIDIAERTLTVYLSRLASRVRLVRRRGIDGAIIIW